MNYAIVFRLLGYVLMIEGALLLLPAAASLVYGEWMVLGVFLLTAAVSAGIGYVLHTIKPRSKVFYMREGFAATSLCWVFISVMGAVPFVLTGCIPNPVDALFETVSGFTTTGASILPGVEDLPKGILFWRSFTHWIGGMGILVFVLAVLPMSGNRLHNLMTEKTTELEILMAPDVDSEFVLYEDDGCTNEYLKGAYLKTRIAVTAGVKTYVHFTNEGDYDTAVESMYLDMIHREKSPFYVQLDGKELPHFLHRRKFEEAESGWYYSQRLKSVQVKYPNPKKDHEIMVSFEQFDLIGM